MRVSPSVSLRQRGRLVDTLQVDSTLVQTQITVNGLTVYGAPTALHPVFLALNCYGKGHLYVQVPYPDLKGLHQVAHITSYTIC
jgi:hypothetical protein